MSNAPYKTKLIEVAMPLEAINKASMHEKKIYHGHPSALHPYWSRKPLATCRAVIFAQLVDDPSAHPDKFRTKADQQKERDRLFAIMEELVAWKNSTNEEVLNKAKAEILASCGSVLPPIYDPFSGGGSIPLEAQRLGLPAYGSDLNPVAVIIGKAMIEIPLLFKDMEPIHPDKPKSLSYKNAEGLAEDVAYYGNWMYERAFERIGHLYPQVHLPSKHGGGKNTVIAWLWARTVPSPDPAWNKLPVPLIRSFDLSTKQGQQIWVEPIVEVENKNYRFEVRSEVEGHTRPHMTGTVSRNGGICLVSRSAMKLPDIRKQAKAGKMKQKLMAVVAEGVRGRKFVAPDRLQEKTAFEMERPEPINDIDLPAKALGYRIQAYGMNTYGELFTDRQLIALNTFNEVIHDVREKIEKDALAGGMSAEQKPLRDNNKSAKAYAEAVSVYLACALGRLASFSNAMTTWDYRSKGNIRGIFSRQAISMTWNFTECNVFSDSTGSFRNAVNWVSKAVEQFVPTGNGELVQHDAQTARFPSNAVISTDPPYYDNIGYADLSDFFFTWMKPALKPVYPDIFGVMATPKSEELVANPYRHGSEEDAEAFFLAGMTETIKNMAENTSSFAPATIYYAFKQSEIEQEGISSKGWSTFLQAVIKAGYAIVGTWPMRTELSTRIHAIGTSSLANSVVLVCRKRRARGTITRAEFIRELKSTLPNAISNLKAANIAPADIPQSSIGPGIGIFSNYQAVLESDDTPMTVKTALQLINRELGNEQGEFDAKTSFALTWYEQFGFNVRDFGTANNVATAKSISAQSLVHAGMAKSPGSKFFLLNRENLKEDWDPAKDSHVTIWKCCQHLIRRMEKTGEFEAAKLMKRIGPERAAAAKELSYALYKIADNKHKDAAEATAYNGLIAVWSNLIAQASTITEANLRGDTQMNMSL